MIDTAITQLESTLATLRQVRDELEAETNDVEQGDAPVAAPVPAAADGPVTAGPLEYDNAKPFKCPACGATYETAVVCTNGHQAEQTLPTAAVLGGAAPTDAPPDGAGAAEAAAAAPVTPPEEQAVVETGATAATPAAVAAPAGPTWPGGDAAGAGA